MTTVLLHGFTGSSHSWSPRIVDGLSSLGRPPVLLDLPGHGRHAGDSDPASHTLGHVFASIDAAAAGAPVEMVGYSMGGRMALAYAATFPDRVARLVLESASPGLESAADRTERRAADEVLAQRLEAEGVRAFVEEWERLPLFESQAALGPDVLRAQRARRLLNHPASLAASLRGLGTGSQPSYWHRLASLRVPTLLLAGALDPKFVELAERMERTLPRARLRVLGGAGHAVHLERPDAWMEAVAAFFAEAGLAPDRHGAEEPESR